MTDKSKCPVTRAVENFLTKSLKRPTGRKNKCPERGVQDLVMNWLRANNFSCNVVESKAVYNPKAGRYISGQAIEGFPDVCGCDPNGLGVFIELKAPGKLTTLRHKQREFLLDKISHNAFACVIDSADGLEFLYKRWLRLRFSKKAADAQNMLRLALPKTPKTKHQPHDLF